MTTNIDLAKALDVAKQAAKKAGAIMTEYRDKNFTVERKGETDLVTEVDLLCEEAIVAVINETYPDHSILAEERGGDDIDDRPKWIIDPIDGTTNYAHGFPVYCASVALEIDKTVMVGIVHDPTRNETFSAISGKGATLNETPINVSSTSEMIEALLATGFPYQIKTTPKNNLKEFGEFAFNAQALRRPGAAALDLCYVAAGRLDGFWEFHLKPWDMAAGALIVTEAGGMVSMSDGKPLDIYQTDIVASNGKLHEKMLLILDN